MKSYFAVPTDRTLGRIKSIMMSAPVTLDWDKMVVPIVLNTDHPDPSSFTGQTFEAQVTRFGHFFNEELQHSQLVAELQSRKLMLRALQLGADHSYVPRWIIQNNATPLARSNKFWLVSVEEALVDRESEPFTFTERVIDV
jgi:hypothetical protein